MARPSKEDETCVVCGERLSHRAIINGRPEPLCRIHDDVIRAWLKWKADGAEV